MTSRILFGFLFTLICFSVFPQKVHKISDIRFLRKGYIITMDGKRTAFRNLNVTQDTVSYYDRNSSIFKISGEEVYKISMKGNYAAVSALSGGVAGFLVSLFGTISWENDDNLKRHRTQAIILSTAFFSLLGGIVGAFIPREIIIYRTRPTISFCPSLNSDYNNRFFASAGIKISLK